MEDNIYDLIIADTGIKFLVNEKIKYRSLKEVISFIIENQLEELEILNLKSDGKIELILKKLEKKCNFFKSENYENRIRLQKK